MQWIKSLKADYEAIRAAPSSAPVATYGFTSKRKRSAVTINRRVQVNGDVAKASREVKAGDTVALRQGAVLRTVVVRGVSGQRGPAPVAQQLYEETADSIAAQAAAREQRRMGSEPALSIEQGRPTKRERRSLDQAKGGWGPRFQAGTLGSWSCRPWPRLLPLA